MFLDLIAAESPTQSGINLLLGYGLLGLFVLFIGWAFLKGRLRWESDSTIDQIREELNRTLDQLQASEAEKQRMHKTLEDQVDRQEAVIETLTDILKKKGRN